MFVFNILFSFLIGFFFARIDDKKEKKILFYVLGALLIILDIAKQIVLVIINGHYSISFFPLYYCSIFIYLFILIYALIGKKIQKYVLDIIFLTSIVFYFSYIPFGFNIISIWEGGINTVSNIFSWLYHIIIGALFIYLLFKKDFLISKFGFVYASVFALVYQILVTYIATPLLKINYLTINIINSVFVRYLHVQNKILQILILFVCYMIVVCALNYIFIWTNKIKDKRKVSLYR